MGKTDSNCTCHYKTTLNGKLDKADGKLICTLFTGQTSKEGILCVTLMSTKENV